METIFQFTSRSKLYTDRRVAFWNQASLKGSIHGKGSRCYHKRLEEIYHFHIPAGQRVLEIGCGDGDLLARVQPSYGLGIDFSEHAISRARRRHPEIDFCCIDGLGFLSKEPFDVVILSDIVNDLWDVQQLFDNISNYSHPGTRIIINTHSRLWTPLLKLAESLGLAQETLDQNWLTKEDIENLLLLSGFEVVKASTEVLCPISIPLINELCNNFLVRFWPFSQLALTNLIIARPKPSCNLIKSQNLPSVSIIVPARNESGNIQAIFERLPDMGSFTELIFVEGNSTDDTYQEVQKQMELHPFVNCKLFKQKGKGKGDAVRLGYDQAQGDVLMILDADLTVPPEYLPRFYEALVNGNGDFINGVRLVYPMEKEAMRFANLLGNKFFSVAFSWLLGQPIKDTLCGTKVLYKRDYQKIANNRSYFGDFDPFGDFDLIFGAVKNNYKIIDLPIRYQERSYGSTNIERWKHGWLLIQMVIFAAFRLKFI